MDSRLSFVKCQFCCKNFNKCQLIEMTENMVSINDEEITYVDLIFDTVCFFKLDITKKSYVCDSCNQNLLNFHFFKRDMMKYGDFKVHLEKLKILARAEEFLNEVENISDLHITQDSTQITLSLKVEEEEAIIGDQYFVYDSEDHFDVAENVLHQEEYLAPEENSIDVKESELRQEIVKHHDEQMIFITDSETSIALQSIKRESAVPMVTPKSTAVKMYQWKPAASKSQETEKEHLQQNNERSFKQRRINTLNDLSEEQIEWIRKEVAASEILEGEKKTFKCTQCPVVLSSAASLTRHLRDVHILKSNKDGKLELKQEVEESKMTLKTSKGEETIWKCLRCQGNRIFRTDQSFRVHLRTIHIRSTQIDKEFIATCKIKIKETGIVKDVWKCPDCGRIFRYRDTLRNHIKINHPNLGREVEESSNKSLSNASYQDSSMIEIVQKLEHKDIGKSSNFCNECGLRFITTKHYKKPKVHKESHEMFKILSPQLPRYACDSCRMIFNSETSYNEHTLIHNESNEVQLTPAEGLSKYGAILYKVATGDADDAVDEAVWKCAHCPVRYFDQNDLLSHVMMMHTAPLSCFIDNRTFYGTSGMSKFIQHMKNKHPELFPNMTYPCGGCNEKLPSIYEKLAHQKVCDSKKFQCDYCSKRFMTKNTLQNHMLYELGLSGYSCEFCGKRCKTHSDLKIHKNVHSQARPYECSVCSKSFKTPGSRSTHMESHNESLTCEICNVKLANRTLYQRHKKFQHNSEFRETQREKNSCAICGKTFLRTTQFKIHMKQMHGIQQL